MCWHGRRDDVKGARVVDAGDRVSRQTQPKKVPDSNFARLLPLRAAIDIFAELGLPPVRYESLRRWRSRGVAGVILESTKFGARYYVTRAGVERFVGACAEGAR